MIRAIAAVLSRLPVLWAKALVFSVVTFVSTAPTAGVAWWIGQRILAGKHIEAHLGDTGVGRAIIGTALYLTAVGLLGLGNGALLRNTAAAISGLFGILFVPIIVRFLPSSWSQPIGKYLPNTLGQAMTQDPHDPTAIVAWSEFGLFCVCTTAVIAAAAVLMRRRDA